MNIIQILKNIKDELSSLGYNPKIVAVSKTFSIDHIRPLIEFDIEYLVKIKFRKHKKNGQK